MSFCKQILIVCIALVTLSCGGGDGGGSILNDGGGGTPPDDIATDDELTWQAGQFLDKSVYVHQCAEPRTGLDPFNNDQPYPDVQATTAHENFFLRSWTNELYLWYDEVIDRDPNLYETSEYFDLLKTEETTDSGAQKDNFHFSQNTEAYLTRTVLGLSVGYGVSFVAIETRPPREFIVRDVVPGSPAGEAGVQRGMKILEIDGVNFAVGNDTDTLNAGLSPEDKGERHQFVFLAQDGSELAVELEATDVSSVPVKAARIIETATGNVGYVHFNSHIRPAEPELYAVFRDFEDGGVTDLVLDLRYNGGGLLSMASQVAYMIAGVESAGKDFYALQFNSKYPDRDPVTGATLNPLPFYSTTLGLSSDINSGLGLAQLNLDRVFVLTTGGTCSASEAIINGLRGIDIEVVLIGDTTCGKPYGFYPRDNCGTTYFSVQFTGINDKGFGLYPEGFSPINKPYATGVTMPGCWVEDDLTRVLGDQEEGLLAAALQYRDTGECPPFPPQSESTSNALQKPSGGLPVYAPESPPSLRNAILTEHGTALR